MGTDRRVPGHPWDPHSDRGEVRRKQLQRPKTMPLKKNQEKVAFLKPRDNEEGQRSGLLDVAVGSNRE